jgi:hypothetical protein
VQKRRPCLETAQTPQRRPLPDFFDDFFAGLLPEDAVSLADIIKALLVNAVPDATG